jgi:vesicle coat complex subunit
MATKDCDSPDVRDRAYMYWRLLSTDPAAAKVIEPSLSFLRFRLFFSLAASADDVSLFELRPSFSPTDLRYLYLKRPSLLPCLMSC